jgi:hypothetical protein
MGLGKLALIKKLRCIFEGWFFKRDQVYLFTQINMCVFRHAALPRWAHLLEDAEAWDAECSLLECTPRSFDIIVWVLHLDVVLSIHLCLQIFFVGNSGEKIISHLLNTKLGASLDHQNSNTSVELHTFTTLTVSPLALSKEISRKRTIYYQLVALAEIALSLYQQLHFTEHFRRTMLHAP